MPQRRLTQTTQSLQVTTPLGQDAFVLEAVEGEEHLSKPFFFSLKLATDKSNLDVSSLVGADATAKLIDGDGNTRYFNGIIIRIQGDGEFYSAELRPWFWILRFSQNSRIFQDQSIPDIVVKVFSDHGYTDYQNSLTAEYKTLKYCVQYQETAFDFVSRLLEEAGITYFFSHQDGKHTLVLADDESAYEACPHSASVPFKQFAPGKDWLDETHINHIKEEYSVTSTGYCADDVNFETPVTSLKSTAGEDKLRVYEYPGIFDDKASGESVARRRLEELQADAQLIGGSSSVRFFAPGYLFTLSGHSNQSLNASYLLRSVRHDASVGEYRNTFVAQPKTCPFRPPRSTSKPCIVGAQTATVVGQANEEVWTDRYGRIKLQFHWDQEGKKDENSSCWIRVAQTWAGKSWGSLVLPRIGQEVVVTFLEGDPDRPMVTGCVYNGTNPVPYALPTDKTKTTWKSNTSTGGGGSNEIRFEDKKDSEEFYLHAQKDMTVEVENDRTTTIQEGNDTLTLAKGNRTIKIEKGEESHSVESTRDVVVTGAETHTNKADFTHKIAGNLKITVDGDITISASGDITIDAGGSLTLKSGSGLTASAGTALTAESGTALSLTGGTTMLLKGSASGTVDGGGMLTVKGGMVKIN